MSNAKLIQGSQEWLDARLGKVTASRVPDVMMAPDKAGYRNYMAELICERLTGVQAEFIKTKPMERGTELEPEARARYMIETGEIVEEVGLIDHPTIAMFGASPDGLISLDGGLEIKCPNTATHLDTLETGQPKKEYILQMQVAMACTKRKWWDFVSYDNRLPEHLAFFKTRIHRDEAKITEIEMAVTSFLAALEVKLETLSKKVA